MMKEEAAAWASAWNVTRLPVADGRAAAVVIDGFLPPRLASRWHSELASSWAASAPCRNDGICAPHSCAWLYTTNDHGSNRKVRSVHGRPERLAAAWSSYRAGRFAYSKWELAAKQAMYGAVGAFMAQLPMRRAVGRAVGMSEEAAAAMGNVSDYFITAFDEGDFLSTHSDSASGSIAWVLHLTHGWDRSRGGALRFNGRSVVDLAPAFNRMVLFYTRPATVNHQVLPVGQPPAARGRTATAVTGGASLRDVRGYRHLAEEAPAASLSFPRFGFTGWYMAPNDRFSAFDLAQNKLMQAAASKGDVCF
ncbi:hypothetical protein AB1Y20_011067 [Prymnesium parvum]|uniref:Prolyl 4-hydroxylase alpha subunit Fe(2+) 2OG dioxygenase domain-containing protein n=1 Tax=Prymnesium parvum TaxID=97485 RepID=A0AB34INI1_PRYPA